MPKYASVQVSVLLAIARTLAHAKDFSNALIAVNRAKAIRVKYV